MEVLQEPRAARKFGEVMPIEPEPREEPALPIVLRGCLWLNLEHEEAVDKYGLWHCKILKRCRVLGQTLEPNDEALLDGATVQTFVSQGRAKVTDRRMVEEAEVISKAQKLGMPQKIREIAAFAPRKREDKFDVRPKEKD